jgi:predicted metal-dependent enzyme (double-stranded beta helix superfamily)
MSYELIFLELPHPTMKCCGRKFSITYYLLLIKLSNVGIYSGREDNIFWRRKETTIEAAGAKSLGVGDVATLGRDIIHSVLNPIGKMTCAIHVYGGDFFDPDEPRSEWDHETLIERPWNIDKVKSLFREAEARFNATKK